MPKVKTSDKLYYPKTGHELTLKQWENWNGLLEKNEQFIVYQDIAYPLCDCMRIDANMLKHFPELEGWQGYWDDTAFSLIVCKYVHGPGGYKMGMFM